MITIISVAVSFFTLSLELALLIGIITAIVPIWLGKFVFVYNAMHVMPAFTAESEGKQLGTLLFQDTFEKQPILGIGTVYESEIAAKAAFAVVKSWNYGLYVEQNKNILISVIRRPQGKYTISVRPGPRHESIEATRKSLIDNSGPNTDPNIIVVQNFIFNHVDYGSSPDKLAFIEKFKEAKSVLFNCFYVRNGDLAAASKRPMRISAISFYDQGDLAAGSLESKLEWFDVTEKLTAEHLALTTELDHKISQNRPRE